MRPGYKQTEVGVIPEDWQVKPFEHVLKIANGQVDPKKQPYSDFVLVAPDHIPEGSGRLQNKVTAREQGARSGKYLFAAGDIVYSKIRPYLRKMILADFDGLCSADMYPLSPKRGANSGFCFYALLGERFSTFADGVSARSGIPKINRDEISEFSFAMPSPNEQKAIAEALSDVDGLIAGLEALIAKKRDLKTATMQQLLTGKTRLPGFGKGVGMKQTELGEIPEDWAVDSIGKLLKITTGSRNTQDRIGDGEYPFFVRSQKVERINSYCFDGEGVLTAGDGVGTGKIFHYIQGKCDFHQRVYLMHDFEPRLVGYFFFVFFREFFYERIMAMTAKSSVDSVRREMIADMAIFLPSREEQEQIANVFRDIEQELAELAVRLAKAKALKQGMMQELLTGRARLI